MNEAMNFIWRYVLRFSCTQKHVNLNTKYYKKGLTKKMHERVSIFMPGLGIMVKGVPLV